MKLPNHDLKNFRNTKGIGLFTKERVIIYKVRV